MKKSGAKKAISMVSAMALAITPISAVGASDAAEYTPAPYALDEGLQGPTEYLEPVFYENEDGPTIGVTLVGVIKEDGKYFKDSNNNQELDVFEDWRKETPERVADLVSKLTVEQRVGLMENQLMCSPTVMTAEEVRDEEGKVVLSQLIKVTDDAMNMTDPEPETETEAEKKEGEEAKPAQQNPAENPHYNSTGEILTYESRSGVLRGTTDVETGALWNNAINMTTEYAAAAKGEAAIPFIIISNPQNVMGIPESMGMAAAVMGDGAADGNYDLIERYAALDRQIWDAKGISRMYGPQIDLITDPRWNRNNGTYTEVPEVMAGIASALVTGYQNGTDGVQDGDVALIMKHFPGDGAAYNGFESHFEIGQWRPYQTEGSLEKYQLPGFQAAIDAGLKGIMPGYSRQAADGTYGSTTQSYRDLVIEPEVIANAYSPVMLEKLLRETMGFDGFINTDSGVLTRGMQFGAEELTEEERIGAVVNAGSDVIGDGFAGNNWEAVRTAYDSGLISPEAMDRANTNILTVTMDMGQFENPYKNVEESIATGDSLAADMEAMGKELNQKSVVLMKNHENVLPLKDTSKKVWVDSFTHEGSNEEKLTAWKELFEGAGFTLVESAEEADIAFLDVVPGGVSNSNTFMNVVDLVDSEEVPELNYPTDTTKTGETVEATTLLDVKKIAKAADKVHENGGIVIASINISSPWILTNLEPYCDGLIGSFSTSAEARMDVLTGAFNPTGKLPITMVSCNEVIAVNDVETDGTVYEICVSPNDVPGYEKDQYMSEEVLAQSPSGSYAYKDADGNMYTSYFGLSYES